MAEYTVTVARSARRELEELPGDTARRVLAKIEALARQPRPRGCRKPLGTNRLWRVRVGEYRIVYEIDDRKAIVDVVVVRHRGDAYR